MKNRYYYDAQTERVLKHLVRVFSEFQVVSHFDSDGNKVYKKVPCRYYGYSRQALYMLNSGSENILQSAPFITISIDNLQLDRGGIRAPVAQDIVVGTNEQNPDGKYIHQLQKQSHVTRFNPIPWELNFSVNIWTTTQTNHFELFEQIAMLFNPSITLQLSNNPLDWTSEMTIELSNNDMTNNGIPAGESTQEDITMSTMRFKTTIWYSLPAKEVRANIIRDIITNITTKSDDQDLSFNIGTLTTDVYTPSNYTIATERLTNGTATERYKVTLMTLYGVPHDDEGRIISWHNYFRHYDPDYLSKKITLRLGLNIEDSTPLIGVVSWIGTEEESNKLIIDIDFSSTTNMSINEFIGSVDKIDDSLYSVGDSIIALEAGKIDEIEVQANDILRKTSTSWEVVSRDSIQYVYCADDQSYYRYEDSLGWFMVVLSKYRTGMWRIGVSA